MDNFQWRNIFKHITPIYKSEKRNRLSPLIKNRVDYFEGKTKNSTMIKVMDEFNKNKQETPKVLKNVPTINEKQANIVIKLVYPATIANFKSSSESLSGKKEALRKAAKHCQPLPISEGEKKIVIADVIRKLFHPHRAPSASPRPKYVVKSIVNKIKSKLSIRNSESKQPLLTRSMRSIKSDIKSLLTNKQMEFFETIQDELIEKSNKRIIGKN